jgi:hypothetical protein
VTHDPVSGKRAAAKSIFNEYLRRFEAKSRKRGFVATPLVTRSRDAHWSRIEKLAMGSALLR